MNLPLTPISPSRGVVLCRNLISPAAGPQRLVVSPALKQVPYIEGSIIARGVAPDYLGTVCLRCSAQPDEEERFKLTVTNRTDLLGTFFVDERPLCGLFTGESFFFFSKSKAYELRGDNGGWQLLDPYSESPRVSFSAGTISEVRAAAGPWIFKGVNFDRVTPALTADHDRQLGEDLAAAYQQAATTAAAGGMFVAPVLVCCRFLDSAGSLLACSRPEVIAPAGWTATDSISVACTRVDEQLQVPQLWVQLKAWTIEVDLAPVLRSSFWAERVASVEICVSPQFHSVDPQAAAATRITQPAAQSPGLTVALPGATVSFASSQSVFASRLLRAAEAFDSLACRSHRFKLSGQSVPIPAYAAASVAAERKAVEAALQAGAASSAASTDPSAEASGTALMEAIRQPAGFLASSVAVNGDAVVWSGISSLPARPLSALYSLVGGLEDVEWSGVMRFTLADGSVRHFNIGASSDMPSEWLPLGFCPMNDVVKAEIWVRRPDGRVAYGKSVLVQSASMAGSIRFSQSLEAEKFTVDDYEPPVVADSPLLPVDSWPGFVVGASLEAPLVAQGALLASHAETVALLPAVKSRSSWDSLRHHFYLFARNGIFALALNAAYRPVSSALIRSAEFDSAEQAVFTPFGAMALAGGALLRVEGSKADVVMPLPEAVGVAWQPPELKLWLRDSRGNLSLLDADSRELSDILSPVSFDRLVQADEQLEFMSADEIWQPSTMPDPEAVDIPVAWCATFDLGAPRRLMGIELFITADDFKGTITVTAPNINGFPDANGQAPSHNPPLLHMKINGPIRHPVKAPLPAYRLTQLTISINALAAPDLTLHHLKIN